MEPGPTVVDDTANERFIVEADGALAELDYELAGDRLILIHTEVPERLGGRGIAGQLVEASVARARREGLTIAPWCPYARRWLGGHPDAVSGVTIDWSDPPLPGAG
jgi:predicted GNAT family acetyltransferase